MGCLNNRNSDIHHALLNHYNPETLDFNLLSPQGIIEELLSLVGGDALILSIRVNPDFLLVWEAITFEGDRTVIQHFISGDDHQTHSWERDQDDCQAPLPLSRASVLVKYSENC